MEKVPSGIPDGEPCEIGCGRKKGDTTKKGRKIVFVRHHLSYDPEITCVLCRQCHAWIHGSMKIYNHPFVVDYGKGEGTNMFAARWYKLVRKYMRSEI